MKLLQKESTYYYELLSRLQFYVLLNSNKDSKVKSLQEYIDISRKDKIIVRDELWKNNKWIDEYVENNPDKLFESELEIIKKWRNRIKDKFIIERMLKKYSIFISSESKVYGVIGITNEIDEVIDRNRIPVYVETVLLPFNGKIIYDGLMSSYAMSFGKGMRDSFKTTYNNAKKNNKIIISI